MHVLVFRHVPFEHLGLIAPALASRGIRHEYVDLFENPAAPVDCEAASGLIFMGGPMSANDERPFIRRELGLIGEALRAGKPVLGVCLGAQLIARAAGARVYNNAVKEIGWAPLHWTEAARRDPLFHDFAAPETVLHWHGETFDLPSGAVWLAYTENCRHQAFRLGANTYGLQFHLEVTPEMIAAWCAAGENAGDVGELGSPIDPRANTARLAELAALVFGRWADGLFPAMALAFQRRAP
ncbi:MAG: gamma-glutamyl-gamma-aminobutyrate hydrolase family protein [Acidobacteriota bacterium]